MDYSEKDLIRNYLTHLNFNFDMPSVTPFHPPCWQYRDSGVAAGALLTYPTGLIVGTCTPNNYAMDPTAPPFDFVCAPGKPCIGPTGQETESPERACCGVKPNLPCYRKHARGVY